MGSREEPGPNYAQNGSGIPEVVGPIPPLFSTIPRLFADTSLRFNMEVLSKRYKRTSADAPSRVLDFSPIVFENGGARASSFFGPFVLQNIVNGLLIGHKRQLGKPTNNMINAVGKRRLNGFRYYHPVAIIRFHPLHGARILSLCLASPQTCLNMHADQKLVHQN